MGEFPRRLQIIDSHTEGEPTRVVIGGWPELRSTSMAARREEFSAEWNDLRRGAVLEPRGFDAVVGALITPPVSAEAHCGVVFFNNVGPLLMCGHGMIGLVRTLEFLGRVKPGRVLVDTPVGAVGAELAVDGLVTLENVPAHCSRRDVELDVPGLGRVRGDVAYGGNWFFLVHWDADAIELANKSRLLEVSNAMMAALAAQGITGDSGAKIDHVELFGRPTRPDADSKNWVLCPGGEYDRSPCGTGTSAKMAALHAAGKLRAGERWRQESITGSLFTGWLEERSGVLIPFIQGRAYITSEATLLFDPQDPFRGGLG
ncbi:MAG: proline racemase family protein [Acidobacteriota bacterium]